MASFDPITKDLITIGSIASGQMVDIAENITSLSVSLTMDQAAELSFSVVDPDFQFARNNYFQIRRDVTYRELVFEIARVEVGRSNSVHPEYRITCYNKNIQMMKRDKKPEAYRGISASDYARTIATRFNMRSVIQNTPKKQSIIKGRGGTTDENVWTVLQRSASEAEFLCFEMDNCLFFCSQTFLLGKWGDPSYQYMGNFFVPFGWPDNDEKAFPGSSSKYILMDMPTFTRSENDPMDAEGTLLVDRTNGVQLRPGMTINITGIPDFENGYLITDVSFDEGTIDPVRVSFRTPVKPSSGQKGKPGVSNTGVPGAGPVTQAEPLGQLAAQLDPSIISSIQDHVRRNFVGGQREAERNFLIQQQVALAVAAAARVYSLPGRADRQRVLNEQLAILGAQNNQAALAALNSVSSRVLNGASPQRNTSGFPTNGIIAAQASFGAYPVAVQTSTVAPSRSVVFRPTVPEIAGSLPRFVEQKVRTFVQSRTYNTSEQQRIISIVLIRARVIYNLTSIESKRASFSSFITQTRTDPIARAAMQEIRLDIIPEPPNSLLSTGLFPMTNSKRN